MSKLIFSEKDIEILSKNPNVLRISGKSITYSGDFKRHFIDKYLQGKLPRVIFEEASFNILLDVNVMNKPPQDG